MNTTGISENVLHTNMLKQVFIENGEINASANSNAKDRKFQASKVWFKSTLKSVEFGKCK